VYILLDALDESSRYGQRDQVLNTIETMRKWLLPGLHLLVTSRDEPDIRESLSPVGDEEVIMKNTEINHDISNFISGQLNIDPKLRKWRAYHDRIQQVLAERAQGV
jgi:Trm5-related predicted tRNA methylase